MFVFFVLCYSRCAQRSTASNRLAVRPTADWLGHLELPALAPAPHRLRSARFGSVRRSTRRDCWRSSLRTRPNRRMRNVREHTRRHTHKLYWSTEPGFGNHVRPKVDTAWRGWIEQLRGQGVDKSRRAWFMHVMKTAANAFECIRMTYWVSQVSSCVTIFLWGR